MKTHRAPPFLQREWSYRRRRLLLCPDVTIFRSRICMRLRAKTELPEIRECGAITHSLPSSSVCPLPATCLASANRNKPNFPFSRDFRGESHGYPFRVSQVDCSVNRMTFLLLVAHSSFCRAFSPVCPLMPNLDTRTGTQKNILSAPPPRPHHLPVARRTHSSPALFM